MQPLLFSWPVHSIWHPFLSGHRTSSLSTVIFLFLYEFPNDFLLLNPCDIACAAHACLTRNLAPSLPARFDLTATRCLTCRLGGRLQDGNPGDRMKNKKNRPESSVFLSLCQRRTAQKVRHTNRWQRVRGQECESKDAAKEQRKSVRSESDVHLFMSMSPLSSF